MLKFAVGLVEIKYKWSKKLLLQNDLFHVGLIDGANLEGRGVRGGDSQMQADRFRMILWFTELLWIIHLIS